MSALIIGAKSKVHDRENSDFYPTPVECTLALLEFLNSNVKTWLAPGSIIHEPACGDGAIGEVFRSLGYTVISSDLRHTGYGMGGVDFLTSTTMHASAIITNPPFNVAELFIKKATAECGIVAMLLKSTYWHAACRYNTFHNLRPAYVLPLTWRPVFVISRGNNPLMEMIWTVWIKGDNVTKYTPLLKPTNQPVLF